MGRTQNILMGATGALLVIGVLLLLVSSCSPTKTIIVKAPLHTRSDSVLISKEVLFSCLKVRRMKMLLETKEFEYLLSLLSGIKEEFHQAVDEEIQAQGIACPAELEGSGNYNPSSFSINDVEGLIRQLKERILLDNAGLLSELQTSELATKQLREALGQDNGISVSFEKPGDLALSTVPIPVPSEHGTVFEKLKEQTQAAIIRYAGAASNRDREKAVKAMLKILTPEVRQSLPETSQVELTVSSVLNSAAIDDRFDYITAYLVLPSLPGPVNGKVSLEKLFFRKFSSLTAPRSVESRALYLRADVHTALNDLRVQFRVIENLKTEAAKIDIGTLKTTTGLEMQGGKEPISSLSVTSVAPKFSYEREDRIAKELDKRSAWVSKDRSLLRITQRGMQEATISGSFSNALTINVPRTDHFVLDIWRNDNGDVKNIRLKNVMQPVYKSIDAIGLVLGTVRIAKPRSSYWNPLIRFNPYVKEGDGVAYTIITEPVRLNLYSHRRDLVRIFLDELLPHAERARQVSLLPLALYGTTPWVKQRLLFEDLNDHTAFLDDLKNRRIELIKHKMKGYYLLRDCKTLKRTMTSDEPLPGEIWIGLESDEGLVTEIPIQGLPATIGGCK